MLSMGVPVSTSLLQSSNQMEGSTSLRMISTNTGGFTAMMVQPLKDFKTLLLCNKELAVTRHTANESIKITLPHLQGLHRMPRRIPKFSALKQMTKLCHLNPLFYQPGPGVMQEEHLTRSRT
ncbi:hypothetical protein L914_16768 [Phytophthora nicotianae]|uniref:Uncharacterized protein n=1 Tax=Phytophthora nicotianae TaxID=4792 RepID=W2MLM9_PHYNI|nr:hypothetical protein L914_16768 [Phytophthora nicotianae]